MNSGDTRNPWRDAETQRTAQGMAAPPLEEVSVPGLTIVAHPDIQRVGERVALPGLVSGRRVALSRLEPTFSPPGQRQLRPLRDPHLSRRPLHLLPGVDPGTVLLDPGDSTTSLRVGGEEVHRPVTVSAQALERGVVLMLGHRVVLVLGLLLPLVPGRATARRFPRDSRWTLVGESRGMVRLRREIGQAAALDVPVLLRGETGTGKDLVARAIHGASRRRTRPFVAVNMAAIPTALAASELFGAAQGAFTGAVRKKAGFFQTAHTGTLFLDEIGETPPEEQALLLRVLEGGEVQPVGSVEPHRVDVRVLAATDADLEAAVAAGRFRRALVHRLAGYQIHLPPLRERRDDIGRLLKYFLQPEQAAGETPFWPPAAVMERLALYDWPGNVRELFNVARRLAIAARSGEQIPLEGLLDELLAPTASLAAEPPTTEAAPGPPPRRRRLRKAEEVSAEELLATLEAHDWQPRAAARALGMSRGTLYRALEAHPEIRTAAALERGEIETALTRHGGDLEAAARTLKVSPHGLKLRWRALAGDV
jgi:two-component system, NtrC family, nitrogen regulation response regulator GlnG